nr:sulfite exporter TauE/SafE family protein [Kineosporia sp. NBRC 101731]
MLFSSALQAVMGFGYAIFSMPLLTMIWGPQEAVCVVIGSGFVVEILVLVASGSRPRSSRRAVLELSLWSVPGLLLGAIALTRVPQIPLQILIALAVVLAVLNQLRSRFPGRSVVTTGAPGHWVDSGVAAPLVGTVSGFLSSCTSLGAPPVVLYLNARLQEPRRVRDTLVMLSVARLPLSVGILLVTSAWVLPAGLPLLWIAAGLGFLLGRKAFQLLSAEFYQRATFGLLVAAAAMALGSVAFGVITG